MRFFNWFKDQTPVLSPPPPSLPMGNIGDFDHGYLPKEDVLIFKQNINLLISQYNITHDRSEKITILKKIQGDITQFDHQFRPSMIAASPGYLAIHEELFKKIKTQFAILRKPSLHQIHEGRSSPLSELITTMSPKKANALLAILIEGNTPNLKKKLAILYKQNDAGDEANRFRDFLQNHEISYLGGGNSKNFKITNINDGNESVLKVDCRLDMPKNVETHLRKELDSHFSPIEAERMVVCQDKHGRSICRTLLVTNYCQGGSLIDERVRLNKVSDVINRASDRFQQMAEIMLRIQEAGCIFPDSKTTNWLVDEHQKLNLADTKSFLFTDKDGNYDNKDPRNKYAIGIIQTYGFTPPELAEPTGQNADHVHAFILGKNIYHYLTGNYPDATVNGNDLNFDHPEFNTEIGKMLTILIKNLVLPDPNTRMSMKDAQHTMSIINSYRTVFNDLTALKFSPNDKLMDQFIQNKKQQIMTSSPSEKIQILNDLKKTIHHLQGNTAVNEIKNIVSNYRNNARLFTIGMNAKADRIEAAMLKIPIEKRQQFMLSDEYSKVLKELASHRHLQKQGKVYLDNNNQIDPKKAAEAFKEFKTKYIDTMIESTSTNKNSSDPEEPHSHEKKH